MNQFNYRYLVPNGISFASLALGITALLMATDGQLLMAGQLIMMSAILDFFDGAAARRLNADSEFGLQLDSLVDLVCFGVAPSVLVFGHLRAEAYELYWGWLAPIFFALAGAFRLARFNLLPPKTNESKDSVGLTITVGGATLTLAVLADLTSAFADFVPNGAFFPLTIIIGVLMASTIPHFSFGRIFRTRWGGIIFIINLGLLWFQFGLFTGWFIVTLIYLVLCSVDAAWRMRFTAEPSTTST